MGEPHLVVDFDVMVHLGRDRLGVGRVDDDVERRVGVRPEPEPAPLDPQDAVARTQH